MITTYITYIHASGNKTTQPLSVFKETADEEVEDYKQYLLDSGEAIKIVD